VHVRQATIDDLPAVERLRLGTFSESRTSVWHGVPLDTQLQVRLRLWALTPHALPGLLVCTDGERVVGTTAIGTTATTVHFSRRMLPVLRPLGVPAMTRLLATWALTHYEPLPDEGYMHSIVVLPEYRRRRVGRALTEASEEFSRSLGKRIASAGVEISNTPSLDLLRSLGYELKRPEPHNLLDRVLMRHRRNIRAEKVL
jgi:ribosomal protein S18 acetylase RimI-like enzyme